MVLQFSIIKTFVIVIPFYSVEIWSWDVVLNPKILFALGCKFEKVVTSVVLEDYQIWGFVIDRLPSLWFSVFFQNLEGNCVLFRCVLAIFYRLAGTSPDPVPQHFPFSNIRLLYQLAFLFSSVKPHVVRFYRAPDRVILQGMSSWWLFLYFALNFGQFY